MLRDRNNPRIRDQLALPEDRAMSSGTRLIPQKESMGEGVLYVKALELRAELCERFDSFIRDDRAASEDSSISCRPGCNHRTI